MNNPLNNPFIWAMAIMQIMAWIFLLAVVVGVFGAAWHILVGGVLFAAFWACVGPVTVGWAFFVYAAFVKAIQQTDDPSSDKS